MLMQVGQGCLIQNDGLGAGNNTLKIRINAFSNKFFAFFTFFVAIGPSAFFFLALFGFIAFAETFGLCWLVWLCDEKPLMDWNVKVTRGGAIRLGTAPAPNVI